MGIIYEPEEGKWWIEAREKSVLIHDCDKREIELDNEEFAEFIISSMPRWIKWE